MRVACRKRHACGSTRQKCYGALAFIHIIARMRASFDTRVAVVRGLTAIHRDDRSPNPADSCPCPYAPSTSRAGE